MNILLSKIRQAKGKDAESHTFEIIGQSIAGLSNYQLDITLSRNDFKMGELHLYVPNSVASTNLRRRTSFITFTTDINHAIATSSDEGSITISICAHKYQRVKGFYYNDDSKLSEKKFSIGSKILIKSLQIVDNEVQLIFRNDLPITPDTLTVKGVVHVWR